MNAIGAITQLAELVHSAARAVRLDALHRDLAFGKAARVAVRDTDRYGRSVGRVYAGSEEVNAEMVRRSAAWVDRRHSYGTALLRLEQTAQAEYRGLWRLPDAEQVPPWEWRAAARSR